jgi:glutathione synthase/RimK-type ligase-like ATP-grasp enzyme
MKKTYWEKLKGLGFVKRLRKTAWYHRLRQQLMVSRPESVEGWDNFEDAEVVTIDWPTTIEKPRIGVVQDFGKYPRWIQYCRFLDSNSFEYDIYDVHSRDWIEDADKYDVIVGFPDSTPFQLREMRRKYQILETHLGKICYPSTKHIMLYEDKILEAYLAEVFDIPFAKTYVSYDESDAMHLIETLSYPVVSKIVPSSGSVGMELVRTKKHARKIVRQAFSGTGRKTHMVYLRQKNYVYFQDYVPNDGYDIRVIVIANWAFGYYRKVLPGDFRASGMDLEERRALPVAAMRIAREINRSIRSPMLVVDMVHGLDGEYYVIEFSPTCLIDDAEQLQVNGVPGVYVFDDADNESFRFEEGRYWLHELALRNFLLKGYLPQRLGADIRTNRVIDDLNLRSAGRPESVSMAHRYSKDRSFEKV